MKEVLPRVLDGAEAVRAAAETVEAGAEAIEERVVAVEEMLPVVEDAAEVAHLLVADEEVRVTFTLPLLALGARRLSLWLCQCGFHAFGTDTVCAGCGAPRTVLPG